MVKSSKLSNELFVKVPPIIHVTPARGNSQPNSRELESVKPVCTPLKRVPSHRPGAHRFSTPRGRENFRPAENCRESPRDWADFQSKERR
jgi:hypothetical protein